MKTINLKKLLRGIAYVAVLPAFISLASCSEDIDESNLYTFTGETIEDYLESRPDSFSSFNYIIKRAGMDNILSAYGQYTCFAPLNEQMDAYVDSLYNDTTQVERPHNGMTGPGLEGLTDSLCQDIAEFHLVSSKLLSVDMTSDPINTMLGRTLTPSVSSETGNTVLNSNSQIIDIDNEVENGVVHIISQPLTRSNRLIASELSRHPELSLFSEALKRTGLADSLTDYVKAGYIKPEVTHDFYVPKEVHVGFTLFPETNRTLNVNGINKFDDLVRYANEQYANCAEWYDYVRNNNIQISTGTDYTNPWNCLNMFVRYHIMKQSVDYTKLVISNNEIAGMPLYEYYETMLPYTLMKVSGSKGSRDRVINKAVRNSTLTNTVPSTGDGLGGFGTDDMHPVEKDGIVIEQFNGDQPLNGCIHPIEGMLVYDHYVPDVVLNERMRFDVASLLWEMNSNNLRNRSENDIRTLNGGKTGKDGGLGGGYVLCGDGFFNNMKIYNGNNTRLYYLPGITADWFNYQKDEFNCLGAYDFALRLPPVPDGTYELRIGFHTNNLRGMMQCYLGEGTSVADQMVTLDIPLDMRVTVSPGQDGTPDANTGWNNWKETKEGDMGVTTDRNMHNLGWMRGPLSFAVSGTFQSGTGRDRGNTNDVVLRRILARREFRQGEYWLRFKTSMPENTTSQFHLDFLELCPQSVYNNATYLEDMY